MKLISGVVFVNKTSVFNNNHSTHFITYIVTNISGQSIYSTSVKQIFELQGRLFVYRLFKRIE